MPDYAVRNIASDEVLPWLACTGTAFFRPIEPAYAAWWAGQADLRRTWGAFDGEDVVGTARSFPTELTVPGPEVVTASALTSVTVAPTHRRRGVLTTLMHAELDAARERGEAASYLVASEWPIYGRFGYGPAVEASDYRVDAHAARFERQPSGRVALVTGDELVKHGRAVYERVRTRQPGAIERPESWWERQLGGVEAAEPGSAARYCLLYRDRAGTPQGFARYHAEGHWQAMRSSSKLTVDDLVAATPEAYHALWAYCCSVDLVAEVAAGRRPVDEVLPWLLVDGRAARHTDRYDLAWLRVLDVAAALAARRYGAPGELVLEVGDPLGIATGVWRLVGGPDGASCEPARSVEPDLALDVGALGSLYLGGVAAQHLAAAGRAVERSPGALSLASAMFTTPLAPWCATSF